MSYSLRGVSVDSPGGVVDANQPAQAPVLPPGAAPFTDTSFGPVKVIFWIIVAIWIWRKIKGKSSTQQKSEE